MGDAKRKALARDAKPDLTDEMRMELLGDNPFQPTYDMIFGMVSFVFSQSGGINHELIGIDFEAGKPKGFNVLLVNKIEDVPRLREGMLMKWPMVVHAVEAWGAPDQSFPASQHPQRYDIIGLMFNTKDMTAFASCRVNYEKRTVEKAELIYPTEVAGRLGRETPTRH